MLLSSDKIDKVVKCRPFVACQSQLSIDLYFKLGVVCLAVAAHEWATSTTAF